MVVRQGRRVEARRSLPRVGDQLELFSAKEGGFVRVPWAGRSPRDLTRVATSVILRAQAKKCVSDLASEGQYDLWPIVKGPAYGGAPLLLPF